MVVINSRECHRNPCNILAKQKKYIWHGTNIWHGTDGRRDGHSDKAITMPPGCGGINVALRVAVAMGNKSELPVTFRSSVMDSTGRTYGPTNGQTDGNNAQCPSFMRRSILSFWCRDGLLMRI